MLAVMVARPTFIGMIVAQLLPLPLNGVLQQSQCPIVLGVANFAICNEFIKIAQPRFTYVEGAF